MTIDSVFLEGSMTRIYSLNTLIVGAGVSGLKAAVSLYDKGVKDIAVLYGSDDSSVSSAAVSDRQNYYLLAGSGKVGDSALKMAEDLTASGEVDGQVALTQAALSQRGFSFLCDHGLEHAEGKYGEVISYGKDPQIGRSLRLTDRASGQIRDLLVREAQNRSIPFLKDYQLIRILTDQDHTRVIGAVILNRSGVRDRYQRFALVNCENIILATGGPGGLYRHSAYPKNHIGSLGLALSAGAAAANAFSHTMGITALNLPLMLNGGFFKALPRIISVNSKGQDACEFLPAYFGSYRQFYVLMRQKGKAWSFDADRVLPGSIERSSLLDLLIDREINGRDRHVFLDYTANPEGISEKTLPCQRLKNLYPEAYEALLDFNIDPSVSMIEIGVCQVHHNGGLMTNHHYETTLPHLFAVGEAAGPENSVNKLGESLNQTQVSAIRAASSIAYHYNDQPLPIDEFISQSRQSYSSVCAVSDRFLASLRQTDAPGINPPYDGSERRPDPIRDLPSDIGRRMDKACGIYRDPGRLEHELKEARIRLSNLTEAYAPSSQADLSALFASYDLLMTQIAVLTSSLDFIQQKKYSLGSFLHYDKEGTLPLEGLPEMYRFSTAGHDKDPEKVQLLTMSEDGSCQIQWRKASPIPPVK